MNMITKFESRSVDTASPKMAIRHLLGKEVQIGACHLQEDRYDGCKENKGHEEGNIQRMKETGESDESCKRSSIKDTSLKYSKWTTGVVLGDIQTHGLIRKVAPTNKLWDGYLQLNPSVSVSAVAVFKSGEKMPDVKWSKSVEVKGKVKLDDFEKYIQDLPRSRNRGLMVVSLLWKEGSSKLALAGMKKVAQRYIEGERVGFAQLSRGIDLYVCPRSDAIITILAKYGFFKGKTAIEENKNSLIGCIVWRRNKINRNTVEHKSERYTQKVAVGKTSPTHLHSESFLESSRKNHAALDLTKQKDRIDRDKNLSKSPLQLQNVRTSSNVLTTQPAPSILPSVSAGPETSYPDPEYQQVSVRQTSKLEFQVCQSGEKQKDLHGRPHRPVLAFPSPDDGTRQTSPILDGEDLPEFDFGTSSGLTCQAVTNRALDSLKADKKLSDKGFGHVNDSLPLTVPTLKSCPTLLHKRRLENHQEILSDDGTHKMPPQKRVCRRDNISKLPLVAYEHSRAMKKPFSTHAKSLFYDDDMPEWCPPVVNFKKQPILVANKSSNAHIHPLGPNLTHPVQYAPTQNLFSSACIASNHPPFPTQTPHFAFHGPVFMGKHAQPRPTNLHIGNVLTSSSMKVNCNQPFRSNSCFVNGKLPINRGVWKGWMS